MTTFEMIEKSINVKIRDNTLNEEYKTSTLRKLDVFLMADRITNEQFEILTTLLGS